MSCIYLYIGKPSTNGPVSVAVGHVSSYGSIPGHPQLIGRPRAIDGKVWIECMPLCHLEMVKKGALQPQIPCGSWLYRGWLPVQQFPPVLGRWSKSSIGICCDVQPS